jgi:hypothetical protein
MIEGTGDRNTIATDFEAQLDAFYTSWVPAFGSTQMNWDAIVTRHYDFTDPRPRLPFMESTISVGLPPTANNDWPAEVSICLSMEGPRESGANMRRRRGRVYLGPWSSATGDLPLLQTAAADTVATGADGAFFGAGAALLAVYSPYTHHGVPVGTKLDPDIHDEIADFLPASFNAVSRVWVDNAWDTQRRRGLQPTYRKTFTR